MDISQLICENWIIVIAVCVILFIIVISLAFGKGGEEKKLKEQIQNLNYEINRLKKENRELRMKRGESLKEELRNVMVTGKSIAGDK